MALYVKDPEVDAMASKLADLKNISKTEVLRRALRRELAEQQSTPSRVEKAQAFIRAINEIPPTGETITKEFIDGLYE